MLFPPKASTSRDRSSSARDSALMASALAKEPRIGGHLFCKDASFTALSLASASVSRRFVWKGITYSGTPDLNFKNLSAVALEDDLASWPQDGYLRPLMASHTATSQTAAVPPGIVLTGSPAKRLSHPQPYRQLARPSKTKATSKALGKFDLKCAKKRAQKEKGVFGRSQRDYLGNRRLRLLSLRRSAPGFLRSLALESSCTIPRSTRA